MPSRPVLPSSRHQDGRALDLSMAQGQERLVGFLQPIGLNGRANRGVGDDLQEAFAVVAGQICDGPQHPFAPQNIVGKGRDGFRRRPLFRLSSLFYRLNVAVLQLPPLRERKDDIPLLMAHFLAQAAQRFNLSPPSWGAADVLRWQTHDWPGNVRELKNTAERICLGLSDGLSGQESDDSSLPGLVVQLEQAERGFIRSALKATGGQVARAAELLKIPRKTLYDKLARYGLRAEDFRDSQGAA